jgi:hypothetical protein
LPGPLPFLGDLGIKTFESIVYENVSCNAKVSDFFDEGYGGTETKPPHLIEEARGRAAVLRMMAGPVYIVDKDNYID